MTLLANKPNLSRHLPLELKKTLVSGFSRQAYGALVPTDLIKIIRWFMDEVLYWSMQGKFLKKFIQKEAGQILYSSPYNFNTSSSGNIEFCCYWYPNGNTKAYQDQVIFGVSLVNMPKHIKSMSIYYRLECKTFDCQWKSIHTFHQSQTKSNNCIGWNPFNLKLSQCHNMDKIDFNCYIDVLRIVYDDGHKTAIDAEVECMNAMLQMTKYQWTIDAKQMDSFANCQLGKTFYSENFGQSGGGQYTLFAAPKGFKSQNLEQNGTEGLNHLMLYLRVLRLPINIKKMSIRYSIKATFTTKGGHHVHKVKECRSVKAGYALNQSTKQTLVNRIPNVTLLSSLSIDIKIEIEEMIDMNDKVIPTEHWAKYGIDMNANRNFHKLKSIFV